MNSDRPLYWALTGRVPFDDEDTPYVTADPVTRAAAEQEFRQFLITTAVELESESDIRERLGVSSTADLIQYTYVTSAFCSEAQIHHG